MIDEGSIGVPVRVEVPQFAVSWTISSELEPIQGEELPVLQYLHVVFAWASLRYTEDLLAIIRFAFRKKYRDPRSERAETNVKYITLPLMLNYRNSVGQAGMDVLIVDNPPKIELRRKAELLENLKEQAVLLKTVAATSPDNDSVKKRLEIQRQFFTEATPDATESKSSSVSLDKIPQKPGIQVPFVQTQGSEILADHFASLH